MLDFCRVKKINEKGFGFLKSLIYPEDVFFHFSQITKEEIKEKLDKMKRGDFFLYFISKKTNEGKRKVFKLWYNLKDVPKHLLSDFVNLVINKFYDDKINVFDLLYAFGEFRQVYELKEADLIRIFNSKKIQHNPTTILPYLNYHEYELLKKTLCVNDYENNKPYWFDELINFKVNK